MIKSTSGAKPTQQANPVVSAQAGGAAHTTSVATTSVALAPMNERFRNAGDTLKFLKQNYVPRLRLHAQAVEAEFHRDAKDQDYPVETIRMVPPHPTLPSLLIVGGMGPLAGAQAMEAALEKFGDSREIVLLQQCNVPDRTRALDDDERQGSVSESHTKVIDAMKDGFMGGEASLECSRMGQSHTVVACNTAHNFAPDAFASYRQERGQNAGLQMHSLVQNVVTELASTQQGQAPVVILGTSGTLRTRLYINPLEANGVHCAVPEPEGQRLLGDAIYKGVKAFKEENTLAYGNALFLDMKAKGQIKEGQPFVILAGCTEVPEIVKVLKEHGAPEVKALLANAQVADPMAITLAHIAQVDATTTPQ